MGQEAAAGHRRADIQGLRAIAVLLVLAYHAGLPLPGGFRGVDVFFVISGFVITAMLLRQLSAGGTISLRRFYLQRARRLTPALAAVVLAVAAASVFLESPLGEQQVTSRTGIAALLLSANYAIHGTVGGYFDAAAEQNPLLHTWSLSVEEQFYLVFPFLVLAAWRIGRGRRSLLALMLGVAGAASLGLAVATALKGADSLLFFGSPTRAWEFAAGALLALGRRSNSERIRGGGTAAAAGAVLLLVAAMLPEGTGSYQLATGLLTVVATVLVLAAGVAGNAFSRALGRKLPVWIGDRSYSLYLWHWPLVVLAEKALPGMPASPLPPPPCRSRPPPRPTAGSSSLSGWFGGGPVSGPPPLHWLTVGRPSASAWCSASAPDSAGATTSCRSTRPRPGRWPTRASTAAPLSRGSGPANAGLQALRAAPT